jgi:hypothetical protein
MIRLVTTLFFLCYLTTNAQDIEVLRGKKGNSGAVWVDRNIPSTLSPYLWLDASKPEYFSSNSNSNTTFTCPANNNSLVRMWLDKSGNNRHFVAPSNSFRPRYYCNTITNPFYQSNAHITSDGVNDDLRYNFTNDPLGVINNDFTFVFVLKAEETVPSPYDSFIASGNSPNVNKNWQFGLSGSIANFSFLLRGHNTVTLVPYDTNPHVFILQRKTVSGTIRVIFSVDGVERANYATNSNLAPTLSELKLFRNRNNNRHINASLYEIFVFNQSLDANQEFELSQYLLSKWGI